MFATRRILAAGLAFLVSLAVAPSLASAQSAGIAPTGDPGPGFDVEGDLQANAPHANTTDWVSGAGGAGAALMSDAGVPNSASTFHATDDYGPTDRTFDGVVTRLLTDPNAWVWVTNQAVGSKDDFHHGLVHIATDATGHHWIVWAIDRRSALGTSFIDCSLWQGSLVRNPNGTFTSNGPHGGRTIGDLLLSMVMIDQLSQAPQLFVSRWQWTGGSYEFVALPTPAAGTAFVGCNVLSTVAVPYGAFGSTSYPLSTFGEAALDLTALLAAVQPGAQFQTVFFSNRTSLAGNAALKDFIDPISLTITTGVDERAGAGLPLARVAPNPSRGEVQVEFTVAAPSHVRLAVYDLAGREVAVLADRLFQPGRYMERWDARRTAPAAAGLYFVRYQVGARVVVRRVALFQ